MPTVHDARALIELLCSCDVKVESAPDRHRLYWLNGVGWVVSDGKDVTTHAELKDAIVKFTELLYT